VNRYRIPVAALVENSSAREEIKRILTGKCPTNGTRESMSAVNLPGRLEEDVVKEMLKFGKLKRNSSEEVNPLAQLSDLLLSLHAFFPIHSLLLKSKFCPRKSIQIEEITRLEIAATQQAGHAPVCFTPIPCLTGVWKKREMMGIDICFGITLMLGEA